MCEQYFPIINQGLELQNFNSIFFLNDGCLFEMWLNVFLSLMGGKTSFQYTRITNKTYLATICPALWPLDFAASNSCLACSFSLTFPSISLPFIVLFQIGESFKVCHFFQWFVSWLSNGTLVDHTYNLKAVIKASLGRVKSNRASLAVGSLLTTLLVTTVLAKR